MVTENPRESSSPHKPKKVWKPKPAAEGVPSLFAHAVLSKPLKINNAATSTVKVKSKEPTAMVGGNKKENQETPKPTHSSSVSKTVNASTTVSPAKSKFSTTKDTAVKSVESVISDATTTSTTNTTGSSKKVASEPPKGRSSTVTKSVSDGVKRATRKSEETNRKANPLVIGGCSSVAGTPQSWPKPHAVSETEKTKNRRTSGKDHKEDEQFHKEIDHLIPEMYRKKSAKQLEQEQKEEIQLMRQIMFELQQQELARQEEALRYKPISIDIDTTLNVLKNAKKVNDQFDDHSSVDSDSSSKRNSGYSTHMKSKLAFFNSHHSVSHDSSDSDESSVSSWNSDESDGLFRG